MFTHHSLLSALTSVPGLTSARGLSLGLSSSSQADRALLERQASFGAQVREAQRARRATRRTSRAGRASRPDRANAAPIATSTPTPTSTPTSTSSSLATPTNSGPVIATPALARLAN